MILEDFENATARLIPVRDDGFEVKVPLADTASGGTRDFS